MLAAHESFDIVPCVGIAQKSNCIQLAHAFDKVGLKALTRIIERLLAGADNRDATNGVRGIGFSN